MPLLFRKILVVLVFALNAGFCAMSQNLSSNGFVENKGQILDQFGIPNREVIAAYFGNNMDFFIRPDGFSYQLKKSRSILQVSGEKEVQIDFHRIDIQFNGLNSDATFSFEDYTVDVENHVQCSAIGKNELYGIRHFKRVLGHSIYPGVDVEFVFIQDENASYPIKFNFILHSASDIDLINLTYSGSESLFLKKNVSTGKADLILNTSLGEMRETVPYSFRKNTGRTEEIQVAYVLKNENEISFQFSNEADRLKPGQLIIDPVPNLNWGTYYGGSDADVGISTEVDPAGFVYLAGNTNSASLIATTGAYQVVFGGGSSNDIFIAKFDFLGTRQWATYFGGSNTDQLTDLFVDASSNLYFTGTTLSTSGIATPGAYRTSLGGGSDGLLGKLGPSGNMLWCTYVGGLLNDIVMSVEASGTSVFITGNTASTASVATAGAYQTVYGGGTNDGFISSYDINGGLLWSSYYGGVLSDTPAALVTDGVGKVFISGTTGSASSIATGGAYQTVLAGASDAFVTCFDFGGNLQWSTYFGGTGIESGLAMTRLSTGDIIISGQTYSATSIATGGAQDITLGGASDAFIAAFSNTGSRLWGSYYGGPSLEFGYALKTDMADNIFLGGFTGSTSGISSAGVFQPAFGGGVLDGFIAEYNSSGVQQWSTYFGGTGDDYIRSISINALGNTFVAGNTSSTNGISSVGAFQTAIGSASYSDAFLASFNGINLLPVRVLDFTTNSNYLDNTVGCFWSVISESNSDHFEIEKSSDAEEWSFVGRVDCQAQLSDYFLNDLSPQTGISYYKLTQLDEQQNRLATRIAVNMFNRHDELLLYPVPSKDVLNLIVPGYGGSTAQLELLNNVGQTIYRTTLNLVDGPNNFRIELIDIPSGQYFVRVMYMQGNIIRANFLHE